MLATDDILTCKYCDRTKVRDHPSVIGFTCQPCRDLEVIMPYLTELEDFRRDVIALVEGEVGALGRHEVRSLNGGWVDASLKSVRTRIERVANA